MRKVADLREAMVSETADLAPRTGPEEILRAGRRRARRRTMTAAAAGVALAAMAVPVAVWSTGGGDPADGLVGGASPGPSATSQTAPPTIVPSGLWDVRSRFRCPADPEAAEAIGDTIWTGVTNSRGKEIMVRFLQNDKTGTHMAAFGVGLGDSATGTVESLGCTFAFLLPPDPRQYPRHGMEFDGPVFTGPDSTTTIVDSFVGPAARITATYDGKPLTVTLRRWSTHPEVVVFWITGVPAGEPVNTRDATHPLVTVYDAAGKVLGTVR